MIDFLKESTFAVNDVINKAWIILYKNYKNIAGLCLTMFFVLWMSTFLSSFRPREFSFFNFLAVAFFIISYFGLQLTLFKYILFAVETEDNSDEGFVHVFAEFIKSKWKVIAINISVPLLFIFVMSLIGGFFDIDTFLFSLFVVFVGLAFVIIRLWNQIKPFFLNIKRFWPSSQHFGRFLVALLISLFTFFAIVLIVGAIFFPLSFLGIDNNKIVGLAIPVGLLLAFIILIRISFFPFFILDQDCSILRSIRFSLAVTRGNFTRLIILMLLLVLGQLVSGYLQTKEYYFLSLAINLIYSLIIVPLSSVIIAVAYRQMMSEYQGDTDPDILDNIL